MREKKQPDVRFKGFGEDWNLKDLNDIASIKARIGWQGLTQKEFLDDGDYYLITGTDFTNGKIDFKNCHFIDKQRYEQDVNIQIKNGDVLITKDGTIGKVAYVTNMNKPTTLNAGVFVIRGKTASISNLYLYHYLAAPYLLEYANQQATGGTIKHLNQNVLVKFPVPISEFEEQTQIGELFKGLDNLIALNQSKYDKLVSMKKACLEKMFPRDGADTPEIRFNGFSGKWQRVTFDVLAEYKKGPFGSALTKDIFVPKGKNSVKIYEQQNAIRKNCRLERYFIAKNYADKLSAFEVHSGDVIVSCAGTIGEIYVLPDDAERGIINQALMRVRIDEKIIEKNLFVYLFSNMIDVFSKIHSNGSAMKNIPPFSDLKPMLVNIPMKCEQLKLVRFLSNLDNLINLRKTELEKLKKIKKFLLEKMFI